MQKIVSFGAIAVMGVAAQQRASGPWGMSNRQTMYGGSLIAGNSFAGSQSWGQQRGVPAPCGCQQACPTPVKTLPQANCCAVANPCDIQEEEPLPRKSCTNVPEKITRASVISWNPNPVCSHIKLGWETPWSNAAGSQASCEMPQMFQIRVKTANGDWEDLAATSARSNRPAGNAFWRPGTPGIHYYRVSNPTLMATPFELPRGALVRWKVRAWNTNGWGQWSDDMAGSQSTSSRLGNSNIRTQRPPGGANCIDSIWNGKACQTQSGKLVPVSGGINANPTCPANEACVSSCKTISIQKPKLCQYANEIQKTCCSVTAPPSGCKCDEACYSQ